MLITKVDTRPASIYNLYQPHPRNRSSLLQLHNFQGHILNPEFLLFYSLENMGDNFFKTFVDSISFNRQLFKVHIPFQIVRIAFVDYFPIYLTPHFLH